MVKVAEAATEAESTHPGMPANLVNSWNKRRASQPAPKVEANSNMLLADNLLP